MTICYVMNLHFKNQLKMKMTWLDKRDALLMESIKEFYGSVCS